MNTRIITITIILLLAAMATLASFGAQAQTVTVAEFQLTPLPTTVRVEAGTVSMVWRSMSDEGIRFETRILVTGCAAGTGKVWLAGSEEFDAWSSNGTDSHADVARATCNAVKRQS